MTDEIKTEVAARILGMVPCFLRQEMRAGRLDLGYVGGTGKHKTYKVYRAKLEAMIGRTLTEAELCDG